MFLIVYVVAIQDILLASQEGWLIAEDMLVLFQHASRERWLNADEMLILFQNRHLFHVSDYTVPAPGFYLVQTPAFTDDHDWNNFPKGRRLRSLILRGVVNFNYSLA
ncbi:Uncharacterized protein Rs2_17862 [Raphanus sativus]|nr:Uncharacterized protein Rs2_17862 [Raphanus sativus]